MKPQSPTKLYALILAVLCSVELSTAASGGGSFVKTTKSYRPADIDQVTALNMREKKAVAWRGERINFQILLWAGRQSVPVKVGANDLVGPGRHKISSRQVKLDFLKFIEMNTRDRYATDPAHVELVPDMLNGDASMKIKANQLQPLWIGVDIPRDAKPGIYKGKIAAKLGTKVLHFPYQITVLKPVVPEVKDWSFDLNLWMHPQATLHYYLGNKGHGQDKDKWTFHKDTTKLMWSDKHLAWYKPTLELLRDAGLKTITVNLVKDPWRSAYKLKSEQAQTNYSYDEMIHWHRKKDGSFTFDFSDFERYVKFCMEMGIDEKIECFSMLPWIRSKFSAVTCYDEAEKKEIIYHFKSWEEYEQVWSSFIEAFVPVLVKNGWFEKTRIGVDERGLGNIPHIIKVLEKYKHEGQPLALSASANRTHSFDDKVEYIAMHGGARTLANNKWNEKQYADWAEGRQAKGLQSTWYTCTGTYPGNFGNSRPAESLFIGWYTARIKADGYQRWSVDSWNDDPTHTTDHKVYETGDTFQLYPGDRDAKVPFTRSSVRFELFRQGIVDYEKIQVLKNQYPECQEAIEIMLEKISRPTIPPRIKGHSSLTYDESTENDFSDILEEAQKELLGITRKYSR